MTLALEVVASVGAVVVLAAGFVEPRPAGEWLVLGGVGGLAGVVCAGLVWLTR